MKKVLLVKLSSLGDVVHTMPAVQDLRRARPDWQIDWVVERSFAPLVRGCSGVNRVIECDLRRWRKSPLSKATRSQWQTFRDSLKQEAYDAVIDLQGLTKSALVARLARMAPGGQRFAMANQTDGSSYEAPSRWVADVALQMPAHSHAVARGRELCARALGYALPADLHYGLQPQILPAVPVDAAARARPALVAWVHGTSRADKLWPEAHWVELGRVLLAAGCHIALVQGNDEEAARSQRLAQALGPAVTVWPRLGLDALLQHLSGTSGVIGVDSGPSHIAVALGLPHVQIYNHDTAWRTGPQGSRRQISVYASPCPGVDAVWQAWQAVTAP